MSVTAGGGQSGQPPDPTGELEVTGEDRVSTEGQPSYSQYQQDENSLPVVVGYLGYHTLHTSLHSFSCFLEWNENVNEEKEISIQMQ